MAATISSGHGFFKCLNVNPFVRARTSLSLISASSSSSSSSSPSYSTQQQQLDEPDDPDAAKSAISVKSQSYFPKKNQTLELVCESLAFKGKGLCKVTDTGYVVLCDRALPGERFVGRVIRKKGNYSEVVKLRTLSPPFDVVEAPCQYASVCGGCKTQNLLYEAQLRYKEDQVRDLMIHVGKFPRSGIMKPIVGCDIQYHYRNKMEFSFATQKWLPAEQLSHKQEGSDAYALGLHAPGFFDKVLNVEKCLLQSHPANTILKTIQDCWTDSSLGLSPYNVHTHAGFLKHLMIRSGRDLETGMIEIMVNFVTSSYKPELLKPLIEKILPIPEVASIVNNVNTSIGNTSVGEEEYTLHGKSTIAEKLRGLTFQISANSFFQTNTHQAEVLYKLIEDCSGLKGDGSEVVLDLFCGTGTIGLTLARRAKHIYGYEVVPQAISDARFNAKLNGIENATFVQGDLNKIDENFGNNFPKPDIVISDPNRPGMHLKLIKFLLKLKAQRIVYVSCNPATCARDLDYLCHGWAEKKLEGCYKLCSVQPVDMFPHTPHIECVCLLELC
ncbi:unnamed protein product [Rhodiola kirilowii]